MALKIKVALQRRAVLPRLRAGLLRVVLGRSHPPRQPPTLQQEPESSGALGPGFGSSAFRERRFRPCPCLGVTVGPRPVAPWAVASSVPRPERAGWRRRGCSGAGGQTPRRSASGAGRMGLRFPAGSRSASAPQTRASLAFLCLFGFFYGAAL